MGYIKDILITLFSKDNVGRGNLESKNYFVRLATLKDLATYDFCNKYIKNKVVLNAACGRGYGGNILLKGKPKKIVCVDIDKDSISYARNNFKDNRLAFQVANVEKLPFKDNSFDVIISIETIEHLKNTGLFLSQIKRVLKPNGLLILSTPNKKSSSRLFNNPYHIHEYTTQELRALLSKSFKISDHFMKETFVKKPVFLAYISAFSRIFFNGSDIISYPSKNKTCFTNIVVCKNIKVN
jgi:ubiquinone/menaquinone biosynthesis C-methylase UbiE